MTSEHTYCVVTRDDDAWLADVPELAGAQTCARTLPALDGAVREVVVLAADRPDADMPMLHLAYEYHTGDPQMDATAGVRALREQAHTIAETATTRINEAATFIVK